MDSYKRRPLGHDLPYMAAVERYLTSLNDVLRPVQVFFTYRKGGRVYMIKTVSLSCIFFFNLRFHFNIYVSLKKKKLFATMKNSITYAIFSLNVHNNF